MFSKQCPFDRTRSPNFRILCSREVRQSWAIAFSKHCPFDRTLPHISKFKKSKYKFWDCSRNFLDWVPQNDHNYYIRRSEKFSISMISTFWYCVELLMSCGVKCLYKYNLKMLGFVFTWSEKLLMNIVLKMLSFWQNPTIFLDSREAIFLVSSKCCPFDRIHHQNVGVCVRTKRANFGQ